MQLVLSYFSTEVELLSQKFRYFSRILLVLKLYKLFQNIFAFTKNDIVVFLEHNLRGYVVYMFSYAAVLFIREEGDIELFITIVPKVV